MLPGSMLGPHAVRERFEQRRETGEGCVLGGIDVGPPILAQALKEIVGWACFGLVESGGLRATSQLGNDFESVASTKWRPKNARPRLLQSILPKVDTQGSDWDEHRCYRSVPG